MDNQKRPNNPAGGAKGGPEREPQPQDRQQQDGKVQAEQARHQDHDASKQQKSGRR